jgi:hypothetical protein
MSAAPVRHSNPIIPTVTAVCVNRSEGPAALVSPALPPPAPKVADAAPAASPAGTKPDPAWLEAIEVSDRVGASHSAALPARLDHIDVGRSTTKLQRNRRDLRRRVGKDAFHQHIRHVLHCKSRSSAHAGRFIDH